VFLLKELMRLFIKLHSSFFAHHKRTPSRSTSAHDDTVMITWQSRASRIPDP
jgi:hypothetical protein